MREKIGFTTTIPVEVIFAAEKIPVDLNNLFITSKKRNEYIERAERDGFPRNICGWIKGIYGAVLENHIETIIAVTRGDCSNTQALMETLQVRGCRVIPFAFPYDRDREFLRLELEKLMRLFGVTTDDVLKVKEELDSLRALLDEIDLLTWRENVVKGGENHFFLVSSSDMMGDTWVFREKTEAFMRDLETRKGETECIRLGYIGVPPIVDDLYDFIEAHGGRVVFNEIQRQFSMPARDLGLIDQYIHYTYPYDIFGRVRDIKEQVRSRELDGIIHYVQSFCFRQIEDIIIRQDLDIPVLTLEGDRPGLIDARTKLRIESFLEMLEGKKEKWTV